MARRRFLFYAALVLLTGLLAGFAYRPDLPARIFRGSPRNYNVVFVVVDALRADHLGCYGYPRPTSRQIDRFASTGTLFEEAFAQLPMTQPSFATMFTSLYPNSHGIKRNDRALADRAVTLAEILKENGWETAGFVGASNLDSVFRLNQGFDHWDDYLGRKYNPTIQRVDLAKWWERRAEEVNRLVFEWLDHRKTNKKFFLFMHYYDPHKPYHAPPPFDTLYERTSDKFSQYTAEYDGEIAYVDLQFSLLLAKLEALHLMNNTLIVLTADHGEGLGEHNWSGHIWRIYDEAIHVPFIVVGPKIPAGKRVHSLVELTDFTPSILDYLNVPEQPQFQGTSWLPAIYKNQVTRKYVMVEKARPPANFKAIEPDWQKWPQAQWAIRTLTHKFIWSSDRHFEFYDLQKDPKELNNLFETNHKEAMELFRQGCEYRARFGRLRLAVKPRRGKNDNDVEEALRALGYVN